LEHFEKGKPKEPKAREKEDQKIEPKI